MKDLTLTADEAKNQDYCCGPDDDENGPKYPWGTSLYLSNVVLDKLGITEQFEVGSTMTLMAKVKVTGVSSRENQKGVDKTVDLQITAMELSEESESMKDADDSQKAGRMFPTMLAQ